MSSIYEARWNNALKWANKVKSYFDTGDFVIRNDGEDYHPSEYKFIIDYSDKLIILVSKHFRLCIYECRLGWDHGSYTTIEDTNKMFAEFKLYKMQQVML